ncbi:FAD-binding oxidoreductase [Algoriella sp.]|uniref:FAD-binding oxidoreductase n=1 Tax=Algoriella sp. TaxID=1872434 RepID=UPI001B07E74A|nr:FAD-binding protein [Algoriella sp.]MBO6211885.1 FAD-binding oxidoreductase [Algoriella sp.]
MMQNDYTKREFLKLLGTGSLGIFFMSFYSFDDFIDDDFLLLTKDDEKYENYRNSFNKRINKLPKYIAVCKTDFAVKKAILFGTQKKLKIAIRSGGHSFEGFSNIDDGLLIHLGLMKNITWLKDNHVKLQPACLLQEIYDNFLPKKRIIPTGSCGTVGIGGLTLGGGYGFFSRKYGLTCDQLYRVKMIDYKGNTIDSDQDPDLLWACKGGGNGNFGVITELYFKTYTAPQSFSGYRLKFSNLTTEKFISVIKLWFKSTQNLPKEAFSAFVLNGKFLTILFTNYEANQINFEKKFTELIAQANEYKPMKNRNLAAALKNYYGIKTPIYFKNASAGLYDGIEDIENGLTKLFEKVTATRGTIYQINTLGGKINEVKTSDSAYPHRDINYLSELQTYWDSPKEEGKFLKAFEEIQQLLRDLGNIKQYRNYPDINFPEANSAYFGTNLARLQQLKKKYDPQNIFDYPQVIK